MRASKWPGRGRHPPGLLQPALLGGCHRKAMGGDCFPPSLSITEPGHSLPASPALPPEVVRVVGGWRKVTESSPHRPDTQKEEVLGRRSRTSLGGNSCSPGASGFHQQVWCQLHAVTGRTHAEPGEPGHWLEFRKARGQSPPHPEGPPSGAPALSSSCERRRVPSTGTWWRLAGGRGST